MKSTTSRSLAPLASCSRIWFLRSTASGAFESASVWFWHTRQRSSSARALTRFSSSGFCAYTPAASIASMKITILAAAIQLLHQRLELLLRDLRRERPDVLVADDALAIDDVGLGHAVDAVVDRDLARGVVNRELVGIAVASKPGQRILAGILVVKADYGDSFGQLGDHRMLDQARRAPRCPHVEQPDFSEHLLLREGRGGLVEPRQLEVRRRSSDQWRGHFAGVQAQADREQHDQGDESDRQPNLAHAATSARRRSGNATR